MPLTPSAHVDTFCRDHLPPADQWPELEFTLPELAYPDRLNCADALLGGTISRLGPDRPALLPQDPAEPAWSYGDLSRTANPVAHVLTDALGLVPGNRVLLRGPNTPWQVACWFGVVLAGGVAVATMPLLRSAELATIGEIAQVHLGLCDERFTLELVAGLPGLRTLTYGDSGELASLAASKPTSFEPVPTAADDVTMIAFTSGTTGRPQ